MTEFDKYMETYHMMVKKAEHCVVRIEAYRKILDITDSLDVRHMIKEEVYNGTEALRVAAESLHDAARLCD